MGCVGKNQKITSLWVVGNITEFIIKLKKHKLLINSIAIIEILCLNQNKNIFMSLSNLIYRTNFES